MSNSVIIKNVNVHPIRGQKVYEINPHLTGSCFDLELNTMIIRRIIKAGHKVEENLPDGRKVALNLENFESDNTVEKPVVTFTTTNSDSELVAKLSKSELKIKELQVKYDELTADYGKEKQESEILISELQKEKTEFEEKIKELTDENEKLKEEVQLHEEMAKEQ